MPNPATGTMSAGVGDGRHSLSSGRGNASLEYTEWRRRERKRECSSWPEFSGLEILAYRSEYVDE
jgi:hypothetical protein